MKKQKRVQPQARFEDLVAVNVQRQVGGAIEKEVRTLERQINANLEVTLRYVSLRLKVIQDLVLEQFKLPEDLIQDKVIELEDSIDSFEKSNEAAEIGDRVRFTVKDVNSEKDEEALKLDSLAKPYQLLKEIEDAMVGLKADESKEVTAKLQNDKEYTFKVTVKRVSKKKKSEESK